MDEATYKAATKRLKAVNKTVEGLDPAIRGQAFELLAPYVTGKRVDRPSKDPVVEENSAASVGTDEEVRARLVSEHGDQKPADNAVMAAATWFAEYGKHRFTVEDLRDIGTELGVTIPDQPGATVRAASRNGKKLFKTVSRGAYEPTVHGVTFFKETYEVAQGQKKPPGTDS